MKPRIKQPEPAYRPFWAVHVRSKSGIAHLTRENAWRFGEYPTAYISACGMRSAAFELQAQGSSGISAPRCKRCMAAMVREENKQC